MEPTEAASTSARGSVFSGSTRLHPAIGLVTSPEQDAARAKPPPLRAGLGVDPADRIDPKLVCGRSHRGWRGCGGGTPPRPRPTPSSRSLSCVQGPNLSMPGLDPGLGTLRKAGTATAPTSV